MVRGMLQGGSRPNPGQSTGQPGRAGPRHRIAKLALLAVVVGPVVRRIAQARRPLASPRHAQLLPPAARSGADAEPLAPSIKTEPPPVTVPTPPAAALAPLPTAATAPPAARPVPQPPVPQVHKRPARVVTYPNREKPQSTVTKLIVIAILIASVALVLTVTIGGWSELEGMTGLNFAWCAIYLVIAFYVGRWKRGLLPIAAALAVLLAAIALIASSGAFGTSWFERAREGFAAPRSLFGGDGLEPDTLGVLTVAIAPVQALLVLFAMRGFTQGWNVELETIADGLAAR